MATTRTIGKGDLDLTIQGVVLEKVVNVSADDEGKKAGDTKQVTVKMSFDGVTLKSVFGAALGAGVIKWQNGSGRKGFATLPKVVEVSFAHAGAKIKTREDKINDLVALGVPKDAATLIVDNPAKATELLNATK